MHAGKYIRLVLHDAYEQQNLDRVKEKMGLKYIRVIYCSRTMEWVNLRQAFTEVLEHFGLTNVVSLTDIPFKWKYDKNMASRVYRTSEVFKHIALLELLNNKTTCKCMSTTWLGAFLDLLTFNETFDFSKASMHVRTMDLKIIQNPNLTDATAMGLNHIPP